MKERIWEKIKSWRGIWFSHPGREVLIKSVLQAIPNYVASCFRLPKALIKDIHKAVAKFWWGSNGEDHKMERTYVAQVGGRARVSGSGKIQPSPYCEKCVAAFEETR